MATDLIPSGISGVLFGAALTSSGVYLPSAIVSQMHLQDFHMLKVFLTASSASALAISLYERFTRYQLNRRPPSSLGWLGPYDGNVIGGAMVGVGMTLTGACPGTVLVQVGTGVSSGRYALVGSLLGGVLYASVSGMLGRKQGASCTSAKSKAVDNSLPGRLGISVGKATLVFEAMCISMIVAARYLAPGNWTPLLDPFFGGLLIGAAQLASLLLTNAPVGVSTSYEDIGRWFSRLFVGDNTKKAPSLPITKSVAFAGGILTSSYLLSKTMPELVVPSSLSTSPIQGILGGMVMVFGARLAGGCTSGHGISGMSMLGTSSIITVASMFAGGIGFALLMQL